MTPFPRPVLGMILKGYPRISETFISNEILLLESLGFRVHIISLREPRETFHHAGVDRIQARVDYLPSTIRGNLKVLLKHNLRQAIRRPWTYGKALLTALRRFSRTRKSATFKHLLQAGYLADRIWPGSGVAHFHAHFAHSPTSVALFASRLTGRPYSFTAHAKDIYTSDPRQLKEKIEQAAFVATCTEYNRRYLARVQNGGQTPIHRFYHGIDLDLFDGNGLPETPRAPYRLLTVARLTAKKGLPTVYRALRLLKDQGLLFEHVLIGDGDDREDILGLIRTLGLESETRWLGTQPHPVVIDHFRRAHLFVLGCEVAQNGDRDGIPNVLVESMAMGVPVVATRVSAIPELVVEGETGLLAPPGDPAELARIMARLLTDPALRARIIPAARRKVLTEFDNRVLIRGLAEVYQRHGLGPAPLVG